MKEPESTVTMQQEQYIESLYEPDPDLEAIRQSLAGHGIRDISVAPGYGRLLTMLVQATKTQNALEIGALGGYSGLCITRGMPKTGKLVSLELDPAYAALAQQNMTRAGYGEQVEYRIGEALPALQQLEAEGRRFDFFFIDADKANYPEYLELAVRLSNPGALIAADNLFLRGRTMSAASQGHSAQQLRAFNRRIAVDPRLTSALLPAYDGLALALVKG